MHMPSGKQPASGPFARAISAEIRAVMGRHRVSQALLAQRVGVSKNYLGKRLRDEVPFTANDIESVCDAMRENLLDLLQAALHRMQRDKQK